MGKVAIGRVHDHIARPNRMFALNPGKLIVELAEIRRLIRVPIRAEREVTAHRGIRNLRKRRLLIRVYSELLCGLTSQFGSIDALWAGVRDLKLVDKRRAERVGFIQSIADKPSRQGILPEWKGLWR